MDLAKQKCDIRHPTNIFTFSASREVEHISQNVY